MNIDAILGETDGRVLTYKGTEFPLPSEIPGECLAPFLREDLGMVKILVDAFTAATDNDETKGWVDVIIDALRSQPDLPFGIFDALKESFRILLGDTYEPLMEKRPGIGFYTAFARSLPDEYGLSVDDFLGSSEPSDTTGTPSSPTSDTTTPVSTPETSGDTPTTDTEPVPPVAPTEPPPFEHVPESV